MTNFFVITSLSTGSSIRVEPTQAALDFIYHHEGNARITTLDGVEVVMCDFSRRYSDLHRSV